ncbi:MAG: hypothetical protein HYZ53_05340 [Planctomycetes bacterium]|nr:hypothetical protein [Planctomycetota bacterium]
MNDSPWSSVVLIALGFAVIYVAIWRPWKRGTGGGSSSRLFRDEAEVERSLDQVLGALQDLSHDTLARLDTKIRLLNRYLSEADDRIRRLEQLSAEPVAGNARREMPSPVAPPATAAAPPTAPAVVTPAAASAPSPAPIAAPSPVTVAPPAVAPLLPLPMPAPPVAPPFVTPPPAPSPAPEPAPSPISTLLTRVYELADRGLPKPEIAREMNRPRGEIELILQLRGLTAADAAGGGRPRAAERPRRPKGSAGDGAAGAAAEAE